MKDVEYTGKRVRKDLKRSTENLYANQVGPKLLAILLGALGLCGLFIVYFGVDLLLDAFYGDNNDSGGSNFAVGLIVICFGLAFCGFFIWLAFKLVQAIDFKSRMRIRWISITAFLASLLLVVYEIFFHHVAFASGEGLAVILLFFICWVSLLSFSGNRSSMDNYWEEPSQAKRSNDFFEDTLSHLE